MYKIFIVEDDITIASLLRECLIKWGFDARCAGDLSAVTSEFDAFEPHIVLLDVSLPFHNGYYWCSEIRKRAPTPVMFISSNSEDLDIVMAMDQGADDYITKPFSTGVLVAKINAVLRRAYDYRAPAVSDSACGAELLPDGTLRYKGAITELTKNEFRILKLLFSSKNTIVRRGDIMKVLWDSESFIDDNTLTVNINRLRKKLADCGLDGIIETKKGEGYVVHDS